MYKGYTMTLFILSVDVIFKCYLSVKAVSLFKFSWLLCSFTFNFQVH